MTVGGWGGMLLELLEFVLQMLVIAAVLMLALGFRLWTVKMQTRKTMHRRLQALVGNERRNRQS